MAEKRPSLSTTWTPAEVRARPSRRRLSVGLGLFVATMVSVALWALIFSAAPKLWAMFVGG
jgi:hypothetical protein